MLAKKQTPYSVGDDTTFSYTKAGWLLLLASRMFESQMFDVVSRQVITNIQDTDQENIMDIAHIGTCMVAHVQLTHIVLVKGHCYRRSSKVSTESQCEVQMIFLAV